MRILQWVENSKAAHLLLSPIWEQTISDLVATVANSKAGPLPSCYGSRELMGILNNV